MVLTFLWAVVAALLGGTVIVSDAFDEDEINYALLACLVWPVSLVVVLVLSIYFVIKDWYLT